MQGGMLSAALKGATLCGSNSRPWIDRLCTPGGDAGVDAISYFESRFPDLPKMPTTGDNANCAEWLHSITTQVPPLTTCT